MDFVRFVFVFVLKFLLFYIFGNLYFVLVFPVFVRMKRKQFQWNLWTEKEKNRKSRDKYKCGVKSTQII